jgi:predicted RNA-binding Zn ribbon-like protein
MAKTARHDLCLAYINTLSWRLSEGREDRLGDPADLAAWSAGAGLLDPGEASAWSAGGERARLDLARALDLRELLFRLFSALAGGELPGAADLAAFNALLGRSLSRIRLERRPGGYALAFRPDAAPLERILDPIVKSAADLLVSPDLERVKICAEPACGWLFFDLSRNRSRRWCDMADCGNRAKARRHYRRRKEQSGPGSAPGGGG